MFNSVALDVVIGLIFVYVLYSLLASTINELFASLFNFRSKTLERAIKRMLDDGGLPVLQKAFYESPIIKYLGDYKATWLFFKGNESKKPSYLLSRNFSEAIVYIFQTKAGLKQNEGDDKEGNADANNIAPKPQLAVTEALGQVMAGLEAFKKSQVSKNLQASETIDYIEHLITSSENNFDTFKTKLETWFDDTMTRATGWYKRKTQLWIFIIGLLLAGIFNVDTIQIVKVLSKDDKIRTQMAEMAVQSVKDTSATKKTVEKQPSKPNSDSTTAKIETNLNHADSAYQNVTKANTVIGLGWTKATWNTFSLGKTSGWLSILGWLLTALAISLGAPFWFDLLSKFVNLRGAGKTNAASAGDKKSKK